ncbi:UDP-glycosyltransferase family 36 member D1 [Carabus blaptoides fortunei]
MSPAPTLLLTVVFGLLSTASALNILGLFPHPGKSHFDVFEPLLQALASKGHNLTVISHFPRRTSLERYTDVSLRGDTDILLNAISIEDFPKSRLVSYSSIGFLIHAAKESCKGLHTKEVQQFLKEDHKFDLIITEMFNTECFLGFVHKYQIPFVGLSSCTLMPWTSKRFGNPTNPAYIPANLLPFSHRMSFLERVENTMFYVMANILFEYFMENPGYVEARKAFGDELPRLDTVASNVSLLLVNTHFSLNLPRPLVPNIIEVGGMYLPKRKALPLNIEKFISESPHGAIYFSMGSMIKAHTFPDEKRDAFLGAFGKLRQRVLWKWENDSMPAKPDNVLIQNWLPQYDILSIEANGAGVILHFSDITEETVTKALNTVLDPSYRKQAKTLSAEFRDRPLSPMDTAIYWVEYVARHGGAPRMRSAAVDMPLYQYLLLDVIAFVLVILALLLVIMYRLAGFILGLMFSNKQEKLKAN